MEIIHQPSWATVHCEVCNQRNCQLSSRGKEWSLGLEGFPGGSAATNLPAAQETWVSSGQEPAMAAHLPVRCLHMWAQLPVTPPPTPSSGLELRRDQALPTAPSQAGVCVPVCVLSGFRHVSLCYPVDGSPPGSSVHGTSQVRVLEWGTTSSSGGPSDPPLPQLLPCTRILDRRATGEAQWGLGGGQ